MIFNIVLAIFLVFLNAFFVASEFAIVKIRGTQLDLLIKKGNKLAKISRHFVENLNDYLSATQLGITFASLGLGWIGEPVIAKMLVELFTIFSNPVNIEIIEKISLPTAFVLITILHIVYGELAPKTIAIIKPEPTVLMIAIPLRLFYIIFKPFIQFLNWIANFSLRILGLRIISGYYEIHTEEEIRQMLEVSSQLGAIEKSEEKLIQNIFEFTDTKAKQIMVPRNRVVAIEMHQELQEILKKFVDEGYSRIPVYKESIDDIVGIIYAKDLLKIAQECNYGAIQFDIQNILREPIFIQEEDKIDYVLRLMQRKKVHIAIVLDEFGGMAGILSIEDILEEIVGEIQDEFDEEPQLVHKISENEFEVLATVNIDDLNELLPVTIQKSNEYETIGGLIYFLTGKIPEVGEKVEFNNIIITVIQRTKQSIQKVKIYIKE